MSESLERKWHFYIDDMLGFCTKVLEYTKHLDADNFAQSGVIYDATLRNIELIGEAATHIPEQVRSQNPDVAWRKVIATRNRLIHGYLGIDNDVLWSIVQTDIPQLLHQLQRIKTQSARQA